MGEAARRPAGIGDRLFEWDAVTEQAGSERVMSCGVSDSQEVAAKHLADALTTAPADHPSRGRIREVEMRMFGAPAYDRKALISLAERAFDGRIVWTPPGGE